MLTHRLSKYSTLVKHSWFAMAVLLLVFCGPVKRLIEYKMSKENPVTFLQNADKQLRTGYRERKDISPLVIPVTQQAPDNSINFVIAASFALMLLHYSKKFNPISPYGIAAINGNFPRYLLLRQLRV